MCIRDRPGDRPADAADVGTGVELAHEAFDDAGGQLGAAEAGQRLAEVGVQAGEGVRAGGVQVGVGAGQGGRDPGAEGVPVGQGLLGGVLAADLLAQQLGQLAGHGAGPAGVDVAVGGVVGVEGLAQPVGRCHQQRWIGAAGHRRWARTVMAASPSTTTRAGAATSCSWAPIIDQSSPTVRPSRWVWAHQRPTGPERPVSPIARFTGTPLVLSPARPPVPSSMTTFGDRCPGPSTGTPTTRHSSRSPAPDLAVNDWPAMDPPPPAAAAPGWSPPGWSPPGWPSPGWSPPGWPSPGSSAASASATAGWSSSGRSASGSSGSWGSSATGWSSSGSGSWPPVSSADPYAMALWD